MKKFLVKILAFFLLFIALNGAYLFLVRNLDWNFKKVLEARNFSEKSFVKLVLGNSLAMDGINTEMLGNAYNLSIGGATLNTNEYQLKNYLEDADQLPSIVILGMASCIDEDYGRNTIHPIIRYLNSNKYDSYYDLPVFQFRWMATEILKKVVSKHHREARLVQGQLRIGKTVADDSEYNGQVETVFDKSKYIELPALEAISDLCTENGIRLIIVEMPGVKSSQNDLPIGPYDLLGGVFYNFNNREFCKRFDSDKHWLGGSHLNELGAEVFTAALLEAVDEL